MRLSFAAAGAFAMVAGGPVFAAADPARFMPAELIAETPAPKAGTAILIGFRMSPRPGWHGYWSNPGDSGIAPAVTWNAPKGVSFEPLRHPAPTLLSADGINSYVHEGPHVLLSRMTVDRSVPTGAPIPIEAKLSWAACTATQCVPLHETMKLRLVSGNGESGPDAAALSDAAARLPRAAPAGRLVTDHGQRTLALPTSIQLDPATTRFFPDDNDAFVTATGQARLRSGALVITGIARAARSPVTGVVTDGHKSYRISFTRQPDAPRPIADQTAKPDVRPMPSMTTEPAVGADVRRQADNNPTGSNADWLPIAVAAVLILGASTAAVLLARRR